MAWVRPLLRRGAGRVAGRLLDPLPGLDTGGHRHGWDGLLRRVPLDGEVGEALEPIGSGDAMLSPDGWIVARRTDDSLSVRHRDQEWLLRIPDGTDRPNWRRRAMPSSMHGPLATPFSHTGR